MIDVSKIRYSLVLVTEDGKQYNIKDFATKLGWEENEKEIATRISFDVKNENTAAGLLSTLGKVGCLVAVFVEYGNRNEEVARGFVTDWKPVISGSTDTLSITCYDELYSLEQSNDLVYFSEGTGTKSAITQILKKWDVPIEKYDGPNVSHGKLAYKTQTIAEAILDILDDAKKKGGKESLIRATKGKVNILGLSSNDTVYCFTADNTKQQSHSASTKGMVTRVKVIGQEDDEGRSSVEATLNGLTKFGIRQKLYTRGKDDSLDDAKKAAQEILDEKGQMQEEMKVQSPDVPFIRKGDLVHIQVGTLQGYYNVKAIRHDADSLSMEMDLKKAEPKVIVEENKAGSKKDYQVGDTVSYKGGTHYVSSYAGSPGYPAGAGKAKITIKGGSGQAHPWHLIHADSSSNVYGWVDDGTFE